MSITATGVAADPLVFLVGRAVVTVGGERKMHGKGGNRGREEGEGEKGRGVRWGGTIHSPYLLLSSAHTEIITRRMYYSIFT